MENRGIFDIDDPKFDVSIAAFFEKEGVRLDKENIKNNSELRYIAKLCLNSLWGKIADEFPNIEDIIYHGDAEVWELLKQAELEVRNIEIAGSKHIVTRLLLINHRKLQIFLLPHLLRPMHG